jgi:hypothetical protein
VSLTRVACVLPATDAGERVAAAVAAAARLPGVDIVLVTDDGSSDETGRIASAAGAVVVTHTRTRGRAAAIESAVNALGVLEQRDRRPECGSLLIVDAALGADVSRCAPLVPPVRDGELDLAIGVPPEADTGLVATTAGRGIAELTDGWTTRAPVTGPRCLTRRAFELASPLSTGWGALVGMSIDVVRAGLRVREIEVSLDPVTPGALEQAAQLRDVTRALAARGLVQDKLKEFQADFRTGGVRGLLNRFRR